MNDIAPQIVFPDPKQDAAERAREFRAMSHERRMGAIRDVLRTGVLMLERSPKRELADEIFRKREEEWRRVQRELFAEQATHGE